MLKPHELHTQPRDALIERARGHGVVRPEVLTQAELVDEIIKHATPESRRRRVRGWLGRARDLVAQVIDKGLHLPDAAKMFLGPLPDEALPVAPAPIATVTLAEIYAAQGYFGKAIRALDEVIEAEPEHREARVLRGRFQEAATRKTESKRKPDVETKQSPPSQETASSTADAKPSNGAATPATSNGDAKTSAKSEIAVQAEPEQVVERDELLATASDSSTVQLSWALRPVRLARARARSEDGHLVIHVLTVDVAEGELRSQTRDVQLEALSGQMSLADMTPGAEVRACLAWRAGEQFMPLTVAPGVRMPVGS